MLGRGCTSCGGRWYARTGKTGGGGAEKTLVVVSGMPRKGDRACTVQRYRRCGRREPYMGFIKENVEKGSTVITDGWQGYSQLAGSNYDHVKRPIAGSGQQAHELLPHVHMIPC
ncbi:transposase [Gillisia sp. Hel_I_86]|uniref:transposase n=1 Tax=Gillisia sp. Hel_I_86 TaxID=1249981 RepID=UPI0039658900